MEAFRHMVNDCIRIGLENDISTMKNLCKLAYKSLAHYDVLSYYKLCAISHAAGILANRKKSIRRNLQPRHPYARKPLLVSCYGFKIVGGSLRVPIGNGGYCNITLNKFLRTTLFPSSLRIRSFTLTSDAVCICYSKRVAEIECCSVEGVDRNLANLTVGNYRQATQYNLSKAVDIAENTRSAVKAFKRNDIRIRKRLYYKYGGRRKQRISQLLNHVSKMIVHQAKEFKSAIALEDITGIRKLYKRGNYQNRAFRSRMNSWSFAEVRRQIEYKARWEGVPVIQLSVKETRGTSKRCPRCGKKITQVDRLTRQLWCGQCEKWMDRDVAAAMNISIKGLARFASSQGLAGEAMVQECGSTEPLILRADASKLGQCRSNLHSTEPLNLTPFAG